MILYILLLLVILSIEATIGLPIFFIYLSYQLVARRQEKVTISALFVLALFLAIFYSLSWPFLTLLVLFFHFFWQRFAKDRIIWKLVSFGLLNLIIFILGKLQFNFFYFFHLLIFGYYFYKTNLKHYAV